MEVKSAPGARMRIQIQNATTSSLRSWMGGATAGPGAVLGALARDLNVTRHTPGVYLRILSTLDSNSSSF